MNGTSGTSLAEHAAWNKSNNHHQAQLELRLALEPFMCVDVRGSASICVEARSTDGEGVRRKPEFTTGIVLSVRAQRAGYPRRGAMERGLDAGREGTISASYTPLATDPMGEALVVSEAIGEQTPLDFLSNVRWENSGYL